MTIEVDLQNHIDALIEIDKELNDISVDLKKRKRILKGHELANIMSRVTSLEKRANLNLKILDKVLPDKVALTDPTGTTATTIIDYSKLDTETLMAIKNAISVRDTKQRHH